MGVSRHLMLALAVSALSSGLLPGFSSPALAEKRVALIIGNGDYANAPRLPNPRNDAEDVGGALRRTGFEVIVGVDLDKPGMEDATIRFARAARDADVAIFYYSGHAMQFAGVNYLMPVDAKLTDEADLRRMARVDDILADLQQARNLRILVLDSCRDNPLADELRRSIGRSRAAGIQRGLAKIENAQGMIVAYATQAGRTADDGSGRNSPFTTAFLKHIEASEEIGTVFRRITADVYQATKRSQLPELSLSLIGEYFLRGRPNIIPPAIPQAPAVVAAAAAWPVVENTTSQAVMEDFIRQFGDTIFGSLARARLEELKLEIKEQESRQAPPAVVPKEQHASVEPTAISREDTPAPERSTPDELVIVDPALLSEIRTRLYELNYDPGPVEGPLRDIARAAIREFETANRLPPTGQPTHGLLRRLRGTDALKPWGAIVYARNSEKWGMGWGKATRREAVASARATCGSARQCNVEISFFGTECGAFAYSPSSFALVARDNSRLAKDTALADCGKRGRACRVIAAVCADGGERVVAND
ncbi:MAG: caspase family protein [Pseudorhodoplanes sp.]|uniref:caspase family protein n=1 Tax=Pseudorhodoplanes sp. TaxID=1934341 RepID=UPI003D0F0AC7